MTKIHAVVEFDFTKLDDAAAKELARLQLENRGFNVASLRVPPNKGAGKTFIPRAGKPGSIVRRGGRSFQVWSEGPTKLDLWVIPVDPQPGDTEVYLTGVDGGKALPHHGDGNPCSPSRITHSGYRIEEIPCPHWSHSQDGAA